MKIYLVEYDDRTNYSIIGAYSTMEKATAAMDPKNDPQNYNITVIDVDSNDLTEMICFRGDSV